MIANAVMPSRAASALLGVEAEQLQRATNS